jgi:hypothetical protein
LSALNPTIVRDFLLERRTTYSRADILDSVDSRVYKGHWDIVWGELFVQVGSNEIFFRYKLLASLSYIKSISAIVNYGSFGPLLRYV